MSFETNEERRKKRGWSGLKEKFHFFFSERRDLFSKSKLASPSSPLFSTFLLLLLPMSSPYAHHSGTGGYSASGCTPTMKQQRGARFGGCCCAAPRGVSNETSFSVFSFFPADSAPSSELLVQSCKSGVSGVAANVVHHANRKERESEENGQLRGRKTR